MFSIDFSTLSEADLLSLSHTQLKDYLPDWERGIWEFIEQWQDVSIEHIKVFTSGSTGQPSSVTHSKEAMRQSAQMTCRALQLKKGDRALLCLPANKISGMMMLVRSMVAGMNLFCMRPSIHPLRELDEKLLFDFAAFTPMQLADISGDRTIFNQAQNIRRVILGGEEIRYGILEEIKKMTNEVYATFGMTETISHVALKRLNGTKPDQYFRTLPGISVAANEMDCLIVHAPQLGQQNLLTKDLVKVISETEFEWLGRIDNVINRGGVKIHPEKIEALLEPYISCPFFIAEINSGSSEAKLLLILETTQVKEEELLTISKAIQALDKLNRPQQIWLLREFKRTENGKIRRRETLESGKEVQQIALPFI